MRPGLVRNVGLGISAVALVWLAACDNNPLSFDVKDGTGIFVNPSEMVVPAGRTGKLESRTVNPANQSTFQEVAWAIDPTCGSGAITVTDDPDEAELIEAGIKPPGAFAVTGGSTLGQTCVVLTSGSLATQVDVTVVAEAITIISAPDTLRAGETGTVVAGLVDASGSAVSPYDPADAGWTSDNEATAAFVADTLGTVTGDFTTVEAGTAVLTVTWLGQAANGTNVSGVVLTDDHVLTVIANVPVAAAFEGSIPALEIASEETLEIVVTDALGNVNDLESEILGVTVASSDEAVATVTGEIVLASAHAMVTVTGVGPGTADISGTVQTSEGDLPFGPETATVIAPSVTSLSAASGGFAETVTITGVGLAADGFNTLVFADGEQLGNFTVVSDTEITAQMPTYNVPTTVNITVEVAGIASIEAITWDQADACNADDFPSTPGPPLYGPIVDVSIPLSCNGTATDADNSNAYFVAPISEDALGGGTAVSVNYAPTWGPPLKDIDWYYCGDGGMTPDGPVGSCVFEIDQPPATVDLDLGVGDHVFLEDDYASYTNGDDTPQPYTVVVTIN